MKPEFKPLRTALRVGRRSLRGLTVGAILFGGALAAEPALAQHPSRPAGVEVGVLSCHERSGWGFIFGSSHGIRCTFSTDDHHVAHYIGDISKFGVDIGYQQGGVLLWTVFAPTNAIGSAALHGHYGGVTAGAAVGVGAGANVLIGGSTRSIALQPLSIEGTTGLNVAAGVAELSLHYVPNS
ncbi:MAG: DUF992 domain-containing protein [Caulobacteraceae bacterium]